MSIIDRPKSLPREVGVPVWNPETNLEGQVSLFAVPRARPIKLLHFMK